MRQIGILSDEREAQLFQDFLLTRGVKSKFEADADTWAVWVFDEDDVATAKQELAAFRVNPGNEQYAGSRDEAGRIRDAMIKDAKDAQKKVVDVRLRWQRPAASRCPVTMAMIGASIVAAFVIGLPPKNEPVLDRLSFASYKDHGSTISYIELKENENDIRRGEVWRVVTPIFIHFGIFHILFNMFGLRDLGMAVELRRGSLRYAAIVLAIAVISNTAQYLYSGPAFGGMSGVVFGLFGYVWMRSRYDPSSGFFMPSNTVMFVMIFFVLCLFDVMGPIANMAHGAGLATGAVLGYVPVMRK